MKKLCKIMVVILSVVFAFGAFAGCSVDTKGVLTIRYYEGGYGKVWLENALKDFGKEREVFAYELIPDANITWQAGMYLKGNNQPDIMMTQGNWKDFVSRGYLEPLTDVYDATVKTKDGTSSVKDYMSKEVKDKFYMQRLYGQGESMPWAMPWATLPCAMSYNETMLLDTTHTSSSGITVQGLAVGEKWTHSPNTADELIAYFADIQEKNKTLADNQKIAPFGWAGDSTNWFYFALYVWWAQYQGVDVSRITNEGSFYDFWNFDSSEVYKQSGIQNALSVLKSLIVKNGEFHNSVVDASSKTSKDVEMEFVKGKVAVMLSGSFLEYEMKDFLDNDGDGKKDYVLKMMRVPSINNAEKKADGSEKKLMYVSADEVMFIPAKAKNKALAKEFLIFLSSYDQAMKFTKTTGSLRPFNYNPLDATETWTDFNRSAFELYFGSDELLYEFPKNAKEINPIFTYKAPTLFQGVDGITVAQKLRSLTPEQIMVSGASGYKSIYASATDSFNTWKIELGIA